MSMFSYDNVEEYYYIEWMYEQINKHKNNKSLSGTILRFLECL